MSRLVSKVDCEFFDEEVASLKSMITTLATTSGEEKPSVQQFISIPTMSSKDTNKIKELSEKTNDLETILTKLLR
jgi:hypothetical protein